MRIKRRPSRVDQHYELSTALSTLLRIPDAASSTEAVGVVHVAGTRREAYHLLLDDPYIGTASELLTHVLDRPFSAEHSGWLIDGREARALIEAAHRALKTKR
jgi:hypothetical protein